VNSDLWLCAGLILRIARIHFLFLPFSPIDLWFSSWVIPLFFFFFFFFFFVFFFFFFYFFFFFFFLLSFRGLEVQS